MNKESGLLDYARALNKKPHGEDQTNLTYHQRKQWHTNLTNKMLSDEKKLRHKDKYEWAQSVIDNPLAIPSKDQVNHVNKQTNMNKNAEQAFINGFLKAAMAMQPPAGANNPKPGQVPQMSSNTGGVAPPGVGGGIAPMQQPAAKPMGGFSMNGGNGNVMQLLGQIMQQRGKGPQPAPPAVQPKHIPQQPPAR